MKRSAVLYICVYVYITNMQDYCAVRYSDPSTEWPVAVAFSDDVDFDDDARLEHIKVCAREAFASGAKYMELEGEKQMELIHLRLAGDFDMLLNIVEDYTYHKHDSEPYHNIPLIIHIGPHTKEIHLSESTIFKR